MSSPNLPGLQETNERLLKLLKWHQLDAGHGAHLLGPAFTLPVLADNAQTLAALSAPATPPTGTHHGPYSIDAVVENVHVNRDWLLGTSDKPGINLSRIGKRISDQGSAHALAPALRTTPGAHLLLLRETGPIEKDLRADTKENVLAVIARPVQGANSMTYEPWGLGALGYERVRQELLTVITYALKHAHIPVTGVTVADGTLDALKNQKLHIAQAMTDTKVNLQTEWYPENLIDPAPDRPELTTIDERTRAGQAAQKL